MRRAARSISWLVLLAVLCLPPGGCSPEDPATPTQPTTQPPATGARTVSVSVSQSSIPADGISAALIIASCYVGGQPAPNNMPVSFTTDRGDFSLNGVDPMNADQPTHSTTLYTSGGTASVYLISEAAPATATINLYFGSDAAAGATIEFVLRDQQIGSVSLTLTPENGNSPLTILASATVKSPNDDTMQGLRVTFEIDDPSATIDDRRVKTDSSGIAATHISGIVRDATVTASVGELFSTKQVRIDNEEAKLLTLEALDETGTARSEPVLVGSSWQMLLRATVGSETSGGSPVPGVAVSFSSNISGASFGRSQVTSNSNGEAETYIFNMGSDGYITASTAGADDTLFVKINRPPVARADVLSGTDANGDGYAGEVNVFVFSAARSYDPDENFGDSITFSWTFNIDSSADVDVSPATSTDEVVTVTVGDATTQPSAGDILTITLTVTDEAGSQDTEVMTLEFQ